MNQKRQRTETDAEARTAPGIPAKSFDRTEPARLYRYRGRVLFSSVDGENSTCYGEFPFEFVSEHDMHVPASSLAVERRALVLSEDCEYDDPRVDHARTVVFDSTEAVESQRIHLDLVVHVSFDAPADGDPEDLATEFVNECNYAFNDGTGQVFNVETEIREHELAGATE